MSAPVQFEQGDIQAMLEKIKQLQEIANKEAQEKQKLLEEKQQMAERLEQTNSKFSALSQKTRDDMMNRINTTIATWFDGMADQLPKETRDQVHNGLQQLAEATAEDSGLYKLMVCASDQHIANVTKLEELRKERDELQQRLNGGRFAAEEDRLGKRKADVISSEPPEQKENEGMWGDFKIMLQNDPGWVSAPGALMGK